MPVYEKKGLIYCVYYDKGRRVWEAFGRGPQAKAGAKARDLEIKLKKQRGQWHPGARAITYKQLVRAYTMARQRSLAAHPGMACSAPSELMPCPS